MRTSRISERGRRGRLGQMDLLPRERVALANEFIELSALLGNPVRGPLLVLTPGRACRLLDELSDVVAEDCDSIFKFWK
jgi:hypothetical protein